MAIEDEIALYEAKRKILEENLVLQEKLLKAQDDTVSELEWELTKRAERNKLDKEYLETLGKSDVQLGDHLAKLQSQIELEESRLPGRKLMDAAALQALEAQRDEMAQLLQMGSDVRDGLAEDLALRIKINDEFEKTVGHAKKFGDRMAGLLGIGMDFEETFIGGMFETGKMMFSLSTQAGGLGKALSTMVDVKSTKLLGLIATRTEELFAKTDEMTASFVKATGANEGFRESMVGSMTSMRNMGLSMDAVGPAAEALYNNTVAFKDAAAGSQREMLTYTATLNQLGVEAGSASQSINILAKTLNVTGKQAMVESSRLMTLADSLSVAPRQMMSDFVTASSVISAHGDHMMQVFGELAAASRATSLSMSELLGIAAQFDTFDSSAEAVGRLNSMLGGPYLNSIDMVYMSESERIRAMLQSIELSGQSWQAMSRLEKRAFANAAGITDMAQANKLFGEGLGAYDAAQSKTKLQAAEQEKLNEIAKDATTLMQNLQNTMAQLAVSLGPVLTLFKGTLDIVSKLLGAFDGLGGKVLFFSMVLFKAHKAAMIFKAGQTALTAGTWLFNAAQAMSNALTKRSLGFFALLAITLAGLHHVLVDPGSPPLYIALVLVGAGIAFMGKMSEQGAPGLLAAGLGIALVGAGVWLAGMGIEYMANAFVTLFNAVADNLSGFAIFTGVMAGLLIVLATFGPAAAVGIAAIGLALLALGPAAALGIALVAGGISLLAEAINSIDKEVMISFKAFTSGFETLAKLPSGESATFDRMVNTVTEIEPAHVENIQDIVDETQRYIAIQATAKLMGITPLIDALTKDEEGTPGTEQSQQQPQPVTIVLDVPGQHQLRLAGKLLVDKGYFSAPANAPKQF